LEAGGKYGLVTNPPNIGRALAGETGTLVVPGSAERVKSDLSRIPRITH